MVEKIEVSVKCPHCSEVYYIDFEVGIVHVKGTLRKAENKPVMKLEVAEPLNSQP